MIHSARRIFLIIVAVTIPVFCLSSSITAKETEAVAGEELSEGAVKFADGLISIQAKDLRPEDLIKEVGEKCAIKIVLYGEVFTDMPLSVQFQQMPVRQGIQRLLRLSQIKNYLMHFGEQEQDKERLVQLDLIGKKGGQRELTTGSHKNIRQLVSEQMKTGEEPPNPQIPKTDRGRMADPQISKEETEKLQQNFLNMMDQMLEQKFEKGEEPDPTALLQLFNDMVPPDMRDKIPPEVLEQLEKLKE